MFPNLSTPVLLPALNELPILTIVVPLSDTTSIFVLEGFLIVTSELGIADPIPTLPVFKDVSAVPPVPTFNSVEEETKKIHDQAKTETEQLIISMNEKFHKTSEIKKNLTQSKINQMKEVAIKEIKDTSVKIALKSVKKIITTTVDKSKLDNLFEKNLEEAKTELKKINS